MSEKNFAFNDGVFFRSLYTKDSMLYYEVVDPLASESRHYLIRIAYESPEHDINGSSFDKPITFQNMKGSIPLDDLRLSMSIPYASRGGGSDDFALVNFLEPLYLSANYLFRVVPLDDDDVSSFIRNGFFSDGLSTLYFVEGNELSKGDHLIDSGKIEEAKSWFKENLCPHALKILVAFYHRGYIESEKEFAYYHDGRNIEKAIFYQEKLLSLSPDNQHFLSTLSCFYQRSKDYKKEYELIQRLLVLTPNNPYTNMVLGKNLIRRGKFLVGLDYYLRYGNTPSNHDRFYDYLILSNKISLMTEEYQALFTLVDTSDFQPLFEFMINGQYKKAEWFLNSQSPSDLRDFYMLLFDGNFNLVEGKLNNQNHIDYYVNKSNNISTGSLQQILKRLKRDNNWF